MLHETDQGKVRSGTIGDVVRLVTDIRDTEERLSAMEAQLEDIRHMPSPPPTASMEHVLAHTFVTYLLHHMPSRVLRDPVLMANCLQRFGLSPHTVVSWASDSESDVMT